VTTVHGRSQSKLSDLQGEHDIEHSYTDLNEMIRDRPFDFAMVCSPPDMHAEQVLALLEAGIPTLIEKPVASSVRDAQTIHDAAESAGVPVRVAHHLRHQPTFVALQDALTSGEMGTVCSASFEWSFTLNHDAPSSRWKLDPALNGLTPLSDAGVHCIDAALALFGPGVLLGVNGSQPEDRGTIEACDLLLAHGAVQVFIRASRRYGPFENRLTISGTDCTTDARSFFTERSSAELTIGTRVVLQEGVNPYQQEVEDFAAIVQGETGMAAGTNTAEALAACRIIGEAESILTER